MPLESQLIVSGFETTANSGVPFGPADASWSSPGAIRNVASKSNFARKTIAHAVRRLGAASSSG